MLLHFFVHRRKSCTFVPSKTERFMDRIRLKDKEFELFIPESDIQAAIAKMAVQIKADVEGKNPLFVGVLNGAFMFVAELMRELDVPYELTFARYSSYQGTSSTRSPFVRYLQFSLLLFAAERYRVCRTEQGESGAERDQPEQVGGSVVVRRFDPGFHRVSDCDINKVKKENL